MTTNMTTDMMTDMTTDMMTDSIDKPVKKVKTDSRVQTVDSRKTVFIKNLPLYLDEASLTALLPNPCQISSARIVKDPQGKSKGFAYVDYSSEEYAQESLSSN